MLYSYRYVVFLNCKYFLAVNTLKIDVKKNINSKFFISHRDWSPHASFHSEGRGNIELDKINNAQFQSKAVADAKYWCLRTGRSCNPLTHPEKQPENRNGNVSCPEHARPLQWWHTRALHVKCAGENKVGQGVEGGWMTCFYLLWGFNTAPAIYPDSIQPSIHLSPDKVPTDIIVFP